MLSWKGIGWHISIASLLPLYLAIRTLVNQHYWHNYSPLRTGLSLSAWMYYVYKMHIPYFISPLRHLPSPEAGLTGHEYIVRSQVPLTSVILDTIQAIPNDGLLTLYGLFHSGPLVFVTNPEAMMEMLNARSYDWHKPRTDATFLKRILGNGLVTAEDQAHKSMRKSVAPAFVGKHIRDLVPLFFEKGRAFADVLAGKISCDDRVIEMMAQTSRVTLDIIGSAGIGADLDTIHNDDNYMANLYETITNEDRGPIVPFFLIMVFVPPFLVERMYGTKYAKVARAIRELRVEIGKLVAAKKASADTAKQKDIVAIIMRSGEFSDEYLCDQLLTFFAAGHDTTASALTWTLYVLSRHPKEQERLREECKRVVGSQTTMDADLLDRLPYLSAVCDEMLRLYPPVPLTARTAVVNTKIKEARIPKGTIGIVSLWSLNRSPQLWGSDAGDFRPERWLDSEKGRASERSEKAALGGAKDTHAFSTFLYGPRSCIGQSFARSEVKCLLLALILRFRFELADPDAEVVVSGFVSIKPAGGMRLKLYDLEKEQ